jgi:Signal transduction histidine kinase
VRRLWPQTLVGRAALVLLVGVLASNLIGVLVYSGDRLDVLTSARGQDLAERLAGAVRLFEQTPGPERRKLARALRRPGLRLFWTQAPIATGDVGGVQGAIVRRALLGELGDAWRDRLILAYGPPPRPRGRGAGGGIGAPTVADGDAEDTPEARPHPPDPSGGDVLLGSLRLSDGSWLNFVAPLAAFAPFWATGYFLIVVGSTVAVAMLSLWAVRHAARPLSMFTAAAERLGRDVDAPPLAEDGPVEVRSAAAAFNRMQTKVQALLRDRTQMLAALSHDLRTPITRLRLRAELIDDEQQQRKMLADLEEIHAMVEASLAFARDSTNREADVAFDLAVLLQTVCEEAEDAGGEAAYAGPDHAQMTGRPQTLKRAFANLVDNAVKYGGHAVVTLETAAEAVRIVVDDDGPGIPDGEIDKVFAPFYRVEASRSRETGGVGLGLAVVLSAVQVHGGRIALRNRREGGLSVLVELPGPDSHRLSAGGTARQRMNAPPVAAPAGDGIDHEQDDR